MFPLLRIGLFVALTLVGLWQLFVRSDSGWGHLLTALVTAYLAWNVYRSYRFYLRAATPATSD